MRTQILLILAFCFGGCSGGDGFSDNTPSTCMNISGLEGLQWDLHNGVIRTDLPGGVPPTISNIGGTYSNPTSPLLGFSYPPGYTPFTVGGSGVVGVDLIRSDNAVVWRYVQASTPGFLSVGDLLNFELDGLREFYGLQGMQPQIICQNQGQGSPAIGISQSFSSVYFTIGGISALLAGTTTITDGLNTTFTGVRLESAPTAEFQSLILEPFLAIDFQLLIGDPDGVQDSDLDGEPDATDAFPFDPNRK